MRYVAPLCIACAVVAAPASAQSRLFAAANEAPAISFRPFVTYGSEQFTANKTFSAVFGTKSATLWGGGLQVVGWRGRIYGEAGATRLTKPNSQLVGQRVFVSDGDVFKLGIPLRATIKPLEIVAGYRFNLFRRVVPYIGVGRISYHYSEQSDFAEPSENVDVTRSGLVFQTGAEARITRWIGAGVDLRHTRVRGIIGDAGASKEFGERDLGGTTASLKIVVGR